MTHGSGSEKLETRAASFDQYRAQAKPLDFRKAMLKQISIGQLVYFEGRVAQAIDRSFFLVSTKKTPGINSYFENNVIVRCPQKCDLIIGDVVRFAARYNGVMTYTTVLGEIVEAPEVFGDHYVLSSVPN